MRIRTYTELCRLPTHLERFEYLKLQGDVGGSTFGHNRYINQSFYTSIEWKRVRDHIIARDMGCDMGLEGHDLHDKIIVHHMNPMLPDDIRGGNADILDPEYLVAVSHNTHNAIHYGDSSLLPQPFVERRPGDTKLWG